MDEKRDIPGDTPGAMSNRPSPRKSLLDAAVDAMNQRDSDAWLALVHPDYEFHAKFVALEGRIYRGPRGLHDYLRDVDEAFEDAFWEAEQVGPESDDDLFVVVRFRARGRASGTPVEISAPAIWTFKDGRLWRSVTFASKAEALEAAGLSESQK